MTRLEKVAAKKKLIEGLGKWLSGAKSKAQTLLTDPKHKVKRRIAAGVAGAGAAALLAKKLMGRKAKGLSKASISKLLKQHKGKLIAGGVGGVGLAALMNSGKS